MKPIRFGELGNARFGLLQIPASGAASAGIVICNPFGQEALRVHRILRVLADRLARAGFAVLRFDYRATGDSDGGDHEGDLEAWTEDILAADDVLRRMSGVSETRWLGLRLGGTLALRAAQRIPNKPARIVTWDAVLDGQAYVEELAAAQEHALHHGALGFAESMARERIGAYPPASHDEILGFPLTPRLVAQLRSIGPGANGDIDGIPTIHLHAGAPSVAGLGVRLESLASGLRWLSDDSDDFPSVPQEAVTRVVARCTEGP